MAKSIFEGRNGRLLKPDTPMDGIRRYIQRKTEDMRKKGINVNDYPFSALWYITWAEARILELEKENNELRHR